MNTSQKENVDYQEVEKFARLADAWWDKTGEFKTLHDINPLRMAFIEQAVDLSRAKVVDVGCGGGILTEALAQKAAETSGIDMAEPSLAVATEHAKQSGLTIDYRCMAVEDLAAQESGQYDVVVCMEMLEHVPDPSAVIRACAALLKSGGKLFLSTLNRNAKSYIQAIVAAEYVLRMLPRGTHDFRKFITPSELARMCRTAGLSTETVSGMKYQPLTQRYFLDADASVNYLLCARKP